MIFFLYLKNEFSNLRDISTIKYVSEFVPPPTQLAPLYYKINYNKLYLDFYCCENSLGISTVQVYRPDISKKSSISYKTTFANKLVTVEKK